VLLADWEGRERPTYGAGVVGMGPLKHDPPKQLEKGVRQSLRALPIQVAIGVLAVGTAWALHRFVGLPVWLVAGLAFLCAFGAVGDAINVFIGRRRIRRLRAGGDAAPQRASRPTRG
jgi:hypothetical protein